MWRVGWFLNSFPRVEGSRGNSTLFLNSLYAFSQRSAAYSPMDFPRPTCLWFCLITSFSFPSGSFFSILKVWIISLLKPFRIPWFHLSDTHNLIIFMRMYTRSRSGSSRCWSLTLRILFFFLIVWGSVCSVACDPESLGNGNCCAVERLAGLLCLRLLPWVGWLWFWSVMDTTHSMSYGGSSTCLWLWSLGVQSQSHVETNPSSIVLIRRSVLSTIFFR